MKEIKKILVWTILFYLRFFAKIALSIANPVIIGIAGSIGKSSTRNALHAILKEYKPTKMVWGNSETGIPLGILGIKESGFGKKDWFLMLLKTPFRIFNLKGVELLIVEMGIDDPNPPKNMEYLLTIVKPNIAISLNISATHTMQFEKAIDDSNKSENRLQRVLKKIAEEDLKIITMSNCKIGIYNKDDFFIESKIAEFKKINKSIKLFSFGESNENDISYKDYKAGINGTEFSFKIKDGEKTLTVMFENFVLPKEYNEVLASVILTALQLKLTPLQIKTALEKNFILPKGRATLFSGLYNSLIIDSSYNASGSAVLAFLDLIKTLKKQINSPSVFLMGDMRELGKEAKMEHEKVAERILETVDYLYCVGPLTKQYVIPYIRNRKNNLKEVEWFNNSYEAGKYLDKRLPKGALVLVKGSQNTIFLEEAVKYILKNREDVKKLCRQENFWLKKKKVSRHPPGDQRGHL